MNKTQLKRIITAKKVAPLAKEMKVKPQKLHNIRFCYGQIIKGNDKEAKKRTGLYKDLKELAEENTEKSSKILKKEILNIPVTTSNSEIKLPDFDFDQLDKLVDDFKLNLASIMASLIKKIVAEETKNEIERQKNKWRTEGALEEQAKIIEMGKKSNLADMLQRKLSGSL